MTDLINILNIKADGFCDFALTMFIQSGILIVLLYAIDLIIRKHVRAVFRYCIWMLIFVKLVLPVSLSSPVSMGQLFGDKLTINKTQIPAAAESDEINRKIIMEVPAAPALSRNIDATENKLRSAEWNREFVETPITPVQKAEDIPSESIPVTWQAVVFLIWLVGVLVLSLLLLQRYLFVKSLLAQSNRANGRLHETLQKCRKLVGVRKKIELRLSKSMLSPAVCGLSKPIILMPAALLDDLSEDKLRAVLIHELSHIKRGDLWVNFMQTILQIIYFYNPLLWFANAVVRGIREKAVDEMVLTNLGDQAKSYSNTLIDIAEIAFSKPHFSLRLVGVVESKKALSGRIKHILTRPIPKSAKLGLVGMATIIIAATFLLPMAKASSSDKKFDVPEEYVGHWKGHAKIIVSWCKQKQLPIDIEIHSNGNVSGFVGDANLKDAKITEKSWVYTKVFKHETPYRIKGDLQGEIIKSESIQRDSVAISIRVEDGRIDGGLVTSGTKTGSKKSMILSAVDVSLAGTGKGHVKITNETKNSSFVATLPNGVTVELLGICEHPSQGKQWWTPDGDLLKDSPYDDEPFGRAFPKYAEKGYKFAVKLSGMAYKGVEFMVIPSDFIQTQRDNVTKKNGKENTKYVEDWVDEKTVAIGASFVEEAESCDIEVGVCFGDWKSKYKYEDDKPNDAVEWVKFENVSLLPNFDQYAGLSEKEQIIRYAESQARLLNHEYIGTEHILLGLIVENTGTVSQILKDSGITGRQVYDEILRLVKRSNRVVFKKNLPMTDRAKLALKNATQLAKESNSDTVNSQHVLLGLLQVEESVGAQVLMNLGLNLEKAKTFAPTPEKAAEQSEFKATLSNGVTVELAGICEYPSEGKQWWKPDGSLLDTPVLLKEAGRVPVGAYGKQYALLFKADKNEIGFKWKNVEGSTGLRSLIAVDEKGKRKNGTSFIAAKAYIPERDTTSITVGVEYGPYETISRYSVSKDAVTGGKVSGIKFTKPSESASGIQINVLHDYEEGMSYSVIAIDFDGKKHYCSGQLFENIENSKRLTKPTFRRGVKLKQIKEFHLQTRPFQWATFKNVSLRPGVKTEVEKDVKQITGKLEFRIIPQSPISSYAARGKNVNLELKQIIQYKYQLEENGPKTDSDDQFIWLAIKGNTRFNSSWIPAYADYNGNKYVLACNTAPAAMKADGSWGLKNVYVKDEYGRPVITVEFDESGAKLINRLTTDYLGNPLAIVIDGKVMTAPLIMSALSGKVKITGSFTQQEAVAIAEGLKKGMPKTAVQVEVKVANGIEGSWWRVSIEDANISVTMKVIPNAKGSVFYKKFTEDYLLELASKCLDQEITKKVGKVSSGDGSSPRELHKRIGFGVPFPFEGMERFKRVNNFNRKWRKLIKQGVYETFGVYVYGSGEQLIYRTDDRVGTIILYLSPNDSNTDILQIKVMLQEVIIQETKPAAPVEEIAEIKEVYLPNFDGDRHQILDLKSGKLIDFPKIDDDFELFAAVVNGKMGEIVYDRSEGRLRIAWLQVSTADGVISIADHFQIFWADHDALPMSQTITTRNGERYKVQFVKADENGCTVKFYPLPGNKTARMDKANAGVEGEPKSASR